ncbi:MAG TPA: membrane protein insertase YidC [Candidatus Limiplasma sp.]|nr:membrane protein insertase YidC [Candidatus Limiplasma sp.]
MLDTIISAIGVALGYVMWACYQFAHNYGLAMLLFTVAAKAVMFPCNILVQKNSIAMVRMKPKLDQLKYQYVDDKDRLLDEQVALYRREHYHPMAGTIPLLFQIPIIFGLLDVIYKPMQHLLHFSGATISQLLSQAERVFGSLGDYPQLRLVELLSVTETAGRLDAFGATSPALMGAIAAIKGLKLSFLGINLAATPSLGAMDNLLLIPLLAGVSAWVMCVIQNRINVLQVEQSKLSQWGMTVFLIAFSTYFAFLVPAGVGLYWIAGNLLSIPIMYLLNILYDPRKYIDYATLERMKARALEAAQKEKRNSKRERADYRRFCKDENQENMRILFYSEQSGFYKYFAGIIRELLNRSDVVIHYVTGDPDDVVFTLNEPRLTPYYVGQKRLIPLMMQVEADVVLMTVPDLEKYYLKRSKVRKDVEYIFLDHGGMSLNMMYRPGALDAYDTVYVASQTQAAEVRAMEKLRGLKAKRLVETGYFLLDDLIAAYRAMPARAEEDRTILIAPSWQEDNLLESCIEPLLESLQTLGCRLIVRPHPQYVRRFPDQVSALMERHRDQIGKGLTVETDFSSNASIYTADLLITDWSAIAYEYSFTTDRPSLFINTKMKVVNPDYQKIGITPPDIALRSQIGLAIEPGEAGNAAHAARELLNTREAYAARIREIKETTYFHLGHTAQVAADDLLERIRIKRPPA